MKNLIVAVTLFALPLAAAAHGNSMHNKSAPATPPEQQAWGIAGVAAKGQRVVDVRMGDDMRFHPDRITVRLGETVRFRIHNAGAMMHEFVIGTPAALEEHAALMERFPNMEHEEPWMAHIAPGKHGEILWTFNRPGEFEFACLIAGHYKAGMRGTLSVTPKGVTP